MSFDVLEKASLYRTNCIGLLASGKDAMTRMKAASYLHQ